MRELTSQAFLRDISLLEEVFGEENVFWPPNQRWILIKNYKLPAFYSKPNTNLLIILPEYYGITKKGIRNFYLDRGLKLRTKNGWEELPHYHPDGSVLLEKGYAWFCLNSVVNWRPKRDTILTFIKLVDLLLENPFKHGI